MDKTTLLKRVIVTVLVILAVTFVIYQIYSANFRQVKTVSAKETLAYDSITCDGFIVHDETLIKYDGGGVISYAVGDGDRVSVDQAVAGIYDSVESAGTRLEAEKLRSRIEALKLLQANSDTITKTPDVLDKNVRSDLVKANLRLNTGDISGADGCTDDVLYYINERQLVTGRSSDYSAKISELEEQYKALQSGISKGKKSKDIKSAETGYFVSSADGYENIIRAEQLESIMPDDMDPEKIKAKEVPENVIGKTINGVYWYAVCPVSAESAIKIKNAGSLQLDIPIVSSEKINVELYSLNQKTKSSDAVAVLRGTYMNEEMASLRKGSFSIILKTHEGIYVPKAAVHDMECTRMVEDEKGNEHKETKTVTGAYVKIGNEVTFRQIIPVFSGEDYIISKLITKEEEIFSSKIGVVQVYDELIVEGANLYDGKIINHTS